MSKKPWEIYSEEENARINDFCKKNSIKRVGQEYYFVIGDTEYKVSPNKTEVNDHITNAFPWENAKACKKVIIQGKRGELIDIYKRIKKEVSKPFAPPIPVPVLEPKVRLIKKRYRIKEEGESTSPVSIIDRLKEVENIPRVEPEIIEIVEEPKPTSIKDKIKVNKRYVDIKIKEETIVDESVNLNTKSTEQKIKLSSPVKNTRLTQKQAMDMLLKKR